MAEVMAARTDGFSQAVADFIVVELQHKAKIYQRQVPMVVAYDPGVVKADNILSCELKDRLKEAVKPLENIDESRKDWHPGSNDQVLDLVHPSLFPVNYGKTRIVSDRLLGLADAVAASGSGIVLSNPVAKRMRTRKFADWDTDDESDYWDRCISKNFQWLPCEFRFDQNGRLRYACLVDRGRRQSPANLIPKSTATSTTCIRKSMETCIGSLRTSRLPLYPYGARRLAL